MTKRKTISARERAKIFECHNGICHLCGGRITAGQAWDVSHPIPLEAGGKDDDTNRFPAHRKCHAVQTATVDAPLIAKTRQQYWRHIGATQPAGNIQSRGFAKKPRPDKLPLPRGAGIYEGVK